MISESNQDHFDRLPDPLLLLIFSKLPDARSLTICLSVSKRFSSLIPFSDAVFLPILPRKPRREPNRGNQVNPWAILRRRKLFPKLLQCFNCFTVSDPAPDPPPEEGEIDSYYSTKEVLKNFRGIRSLHVQLPSFGSELGPFGDESLIKWKAEFGNELKRCVVLGATSFSRNSISPNSNSQIGEESESQQSEQTLTDDELKIRVIWTISCLISASARHFLFKQIVTEHPELEKVVISDANKQGELRMGKSELYEMRSSAERDVDFSVTERTPVPEMSLKLWFLPVLVLPATGWVMKGATLAVIGPAGNGMMEMEKEKENGDDSLEGCFDGEGEEGKAFGEAVRKMMKVGKSYLMTMSSF